MAGYLKKGDQLLERSDRTERGIEIMSRAMAANDVKFNAMNEKFNQEIKQLREDQNRMREEQGVVLKELVSVSKRVAVVEDKH
jgi:sensor histidine kinase YesM